MQQALVAIVLVALRRFRGSVLFPGPRPSSSQRVPSWLSGLTRQSSGPAKGGPLTLVVGHYYEQVEAMGINCGSSYCYCLPWSMVDGAAVGCIY